MADESVRGLVPLSETDKWKVADGDPDPRGWEVVTRDNTRVGKVKDLIVDTSASRARYLVAQLNDRVVGADGRQVLIPIGTAQLGPDDQVIVPELTAAQLGNIPAYDRNRFSRAYEESLRPHFGAPAAVPGGDFYASEHFDESRFYGTRTPGEEREEVVTEKRPALNEEVVVPRHAIPDTGKVEADLRKDRIDADRKIEEKEAGRRPS
ncbi:MAG TPA: PRC-barrel domain-containing protein [Gemmatimonadaceae bacterium]|nr:PRC-barrel domain-containing protein [Gemmatimonadaceae bacterium]